MEEIGIAAEAAPSGVVASGSGEGREHKKKKDKKKRKEREREQQASGAVGGPLHGVASGSVADASSAPLKEEATSRPAEGENPLKKLKLTIKLGPKPEAGQPQ